MYRYVLLFKRFKEVNKNERVKIEMNKIFLYTIITISLILASIFSLVIIFRGNNSTNIVDEENIKDMQELKEFDITVFSILDLMPGANPSKEAYFAFSLNGIDNNRFFNEYEINSIELNGNKIRNQDIIYQDYNGFRFYTSDYKHDNTIVVIIKNKKTNEKYYKKLVVSTKKVM